MMMITIKDLRNVFNGNIPIDIYERGKLIYFNDTLKYVPTELDDREIISGDIINNRMEVQI